MEIKTPVSTTIKYADGSETVIRYNPLGERMDETTIPAEEVTPSVESSEAPAENVDASEAPASEAPIES